MPKRTTTFALPLGEPFVFEVDEDADDDEALAAFLRARDLGRLLDWLDTAEKLPATQIPPVELTAEDCALAQRACEIAAGQTASEPLNDLGTALAALLLAYPNHVGTRLRWAASAGVGAGWPPINSAPPRPS